MWGGSNFIFRTRSGLYKVLVQPQPALTQALSAIFQYGYSFDLNFETQSDDPLDYLNRPFGGCENMGGGSNFTFRTRSGLQKVLVQPQLALTWALSAIFQYGYSFNLNFETQSDDPLDYLKRPLGCCENMWGGCNFTFITRSGLQKVLVQPQTALTWAQF